MIEDMSHEDLVEVVRAASRWEIAVMAHRGGRFAGLTGRKLALLEVARLNAEEGLLEAIDLLVPEGDEPTLAETVGPIA